MNEKILNELKDTDELRPDEHDGSYELMRATIGAYANSSSFDILDFNDLNIVYLMSVGTWRHGVDAKRKLIPNGHLAEADKQTLLNTLDKIVQNSKDGKYSNREASHEDAFGMFGTGFYSFKNKTDEVSVKNFIRLCVEIKDMDDDEAIFDKAQLVLTSAYRGMKAASASMVLHCLKPYTFPVLNGNMGSSDIFKELDISLKNKGELNTYIENCRKIKAFRDRNLPFKNYRVLDMKAWEIGKIDIEAIEKYLKNYAGQEYEKPDKAGDKAAEMKQLQETGVYAREQFAELGKTVIGQFDDYEMGTSSGWINQGQIVPDYFWIEYKKKGCKESKSSISLFFEVIEGAYQFMLAVEARDSACQKEDFDKHNRFVYKEMYDPELYYRVENKKSEYFNPDYGRNEIIRRYEDGEYKKIRLQRNIAGPYMNEMFGEIIKQIQDSVQRLEPYYEEAIRDMQPIPGGETGNIELNYGKNLNKDKNLILYGPPGTGKTYNTINYAVAIIDNEEISEIEKKPYEEVFNRYLDLKKSGRIAFTTFHQSYGYEEFIEGIKPVIKSQEDTESSDIHYEYTNGVFKDFCNKAKQVKVQASSLEIRENPVVWNVLLDGTGQSELKKECFAKSYIKIGWSNVDKEVTDQTENLSSMARRILLNFQDEIEIGDIIFVQRDNTSIDAIGIITGPYEFIEEDKDYPRKRTVKWIATEINEKVYVLNKSTKLDRKSIYPLKKMEIKDVIELVERYALDITIQVNENVEPYVFIIDEINRGNISKIFGELITLIENTKRIGESEEVSAILPYTKEPFGVPNNVYIIGTMNTADKSIALMDTALRRRFEFVEKMPKSEVLTKLGLKEIDGIDIVQMLETINKRIECLFDREHMIGHAYFTPLIKDPSLDKLAKIFRNAIIPLLQEYFYEDYSRIQLVLGDNAKTKDDYKFILDSDIKIKDVFKGNPDIDVPEKKYSIEYDAFYKVESYKQIYLKV